ncbi:MAG: protein tyrosine phosphatase family protein [Acidimicrobiia bacterium]
MSIEDSVNFRRVSDAVTTSGVVTSDDLRGLGAEGYDAVVNLLPADSPYAVVDEAGIVSDQGLDYVHIPVDFAAPSHDDFETFAAAMDVNAGKHVHVHCAANFRVSAFYSVYAVRKGWWSAAEADAHVRGLWDPAEHPAWDAFLAAERSRPAT